MNIVSKNSGTENIDALIYQIHAEMAQDNAEGLQSQQSLLKTYLKQAKFFREERIKDVQERIKASGIEDRLKTRIKE